MSFSDIFCKTEWEYWLQRVKDREVNSYHTYITEVIRIDRISGERMHKTVYVTHPYARQGDYSAYITTPEQIAFSVAWERIKLLFETDYNECDFCIRVTDILGQEILRTFL